MFPELRASAGENQNYKGKPVEYFLVSIPDEYLLREGEITRNSKLRDFRV